MQQLLLTLLLHSTHPTLGACCTFRALALLLFLTPQTQAAVNISLLIGK